MKAHQIDKRMETFAKALRQAGLKVTHQRTEIFREVARSVEHPDAETVFRRVRRRIPAVSLDTVYRTLCLLEKQRLLWRIEVVCDRARFDANMERHHHFACTRCRRIVDFYSRAIDALRIQPSVKGLGAAQSFHVLVRGVCSQCLSTKHKAGRTR